MAGGRIIRPAERGMTLMEMLIVLAIIGVAAGAVSLGIGAATRAPSAEAEAHRLATRLQAAADDAMLGDRMIAFTARDHGYGFATFDGGAWVPRTDDATGFHTLPGGMVIRLSARPPIILGVDGSGQPLTATIESGDQHWVVRYDGMTATATQVPAT
ncbi:prepilin-type N-terminal cleavage/methylation domain-containing protein [Stakelama saccharophila]|uniref:Prepilin-type N-terminal cleavage/methylation domain-containing protein n=1 Tax=Stakelama saccharophila TaxID=3075605 RepID=A0ABZ0BEI3_9SPHN|nr:prepilin-type N-terminal cleavage/methylation domain-containing protein [Stakelama sp. W311]WNO54789.1 prepilin-type N-terminal cleavage/methylation domain-containing protein [Stakelama sp. W311]